MPVRAGTSGWQYADWRGRFYPHRLPQRQWLEFYADRFDTVEVNNAFYRLPERSTFEAWAQRTPAGFVVTVKASRFLTHIKRLRDPAEPVTRLMERVEGLGGKVGPLLLQLPPPSVPMPASSTTASPASPPGPGSPSSRVISHGGHPRRRGSSSVVVPRWPGPTGSAVR